MSTQPESVSQIDTVSKTPLSESIQQLFSRLRSSDVEQFINAYKFWTLHQEIDLLNLQIALIQQELLANEEQLHLAQPTAIEQAALAQLQSSGVSDIDLLDRMHARGELWLDNAVQLLEHCERLDMIQGNYTQWCEHALEGAYDWLSSIDDNDLSEAQPANTQTTEPVESVHRNEVDELPEELLLQKLFSENEATIPQADLSEAALELPEEPSDTNNTELNTISFDEQTEVEDLPEQSEVEAIPQEDIPEAASELPQEPSNTTSAAQNIISSDEETTSELPQEPSDTTSAAQNTTSFDEETEEDVSEQPEAVLTEEPTLIDASEAVLVEPEADMELAPETAEESPTNEEDANTSAETPEENPNTESSTSVSANTPSPAQEPLAESEVAEDQETHEISEYTETLGEPIEHSETLDEPNEPVEHSETLDEPNEPVEHSETLDEPTDSVEEVEKETEQPHSSKRNRLVQRFVGRIFPKG